MIVVSLIYICTIDESIKCRMKFGIIPKNETAIMNGYLCKTCGAIYDLGAIFASCEVVQAAIFVPCKNCGCQYIYAAYQKLNQYKILRPKSTKTYYEAQRNNWCDAAIFDSFDDWIVCDVGDARFSLDELLDESRFLSTYASNFCCDLCGVNRCLEIDFIEDQTNVKCAICKCDMCHLYTAM